MGVIIAHPITRFPRVTTFSTALDPLEDLLLHLEFLTAPDSAAELLRNRCIADPDAHLRAAKVSAHARVARSFAENAIHGSELASFVSCYYAAMNLAKLIILFSDLHGELDENRYHGLSYDPLADPESLVSDRVKLHRKGVLPLLYRSITGEEPTQRKRVIETADLYRWIPGCSYEWGIASGAATLMATAALEATVIAEEARLRVRVSTGLDYDPPLSHLDALRGVEAVPDQPGVFRSSKKYSPDESPLSMADEALVRNRLFHPNAGETQFAVGRLSGIPIIEELPLLMALFHLSSIARYNPDFMSQVRRSRYWPVVAAVRTHGLYKMLLLTWSHVRGETVILNVG